MKKFYISNENELNELEKKTGYVSYKRIIDRYINSLVLCNNITEVDKLVYEYMSNFDEEIFQYYLCNLTDFEKEILIEYGIILSYSEKLELNVLCVEHWGTSWDYVMTDVEWTTNYDDCK